MSLTHGNHHHDNRITSRDHFTNGIRSLAVQGGKRLIQHGFDKAYEHVTKKRTTNKPYQKAVEQTVPREHGYNKQTGILYRSKAVKNKPHPKKGVFRYQQTHSGIVTGAAGLQAVNDICLIGTVNQSITSTGVGYNIGANQQSIMSLNPYDKISGSSLFTAGATVSDSRFMLNENDVSIEFTNTSNVTAICDLYIIKYKKNSANLPSNTWGQGYISDAITPQVLSVAPTPGLAVAGVLGYPSYGFVGTRPGQSPQFREFFKVIKDEHFELTPGSTFVSTTRYMQDIVQKQDELANMLGQSIYFKKGQTLGFMLVQRGQIVIDTTLVHTPTYGSTTIAYIVTSKTVASCVADNAKRINVAENISAVPANTLFANQNFINVIDASDVAQERN